MGQLKNVREVRTIHDLDCQSALEYYLMWFKELNDLYLSKGCSQHDIQKECTLSTNTEPSQLNYLHHLQVKICILLCKLHHHSLVKELVDAHVFTHSLSTPCLHHELTSQMLDWGRLQWS
uniref:Uncharacterized protein n=1 Tax=Spongospora subterranea TaxID=70186 RepID=A0A0H5R1I1_9EUKA|eukprot:CRZ01674.1 hypothetical protein [Spongospora subterranea]